MPVSNDRSQIRAARAAFATARRAVITRLDEVATAIAAVKDAERKYAEGRPELALARSNRDTAVGNAATARSDERNRRSDLLGLLNGWVPKAVTIDDDFTRLLTTAPLVLYPVRVETRFDLNPTAPVLKVRIYPDEIFINLHEPALTREEYNAAVRYYQARDRGADTPELWRQITRLMAPERAAYVLRIMTPTFGGGTSTSGGTTTSGGGSMQFPTDVQLRASDFTRPSEAVLPDRWIVRTIRSGKATDYPGNPIPEPLTMTADPAEKADTELFTIPGSNPVLKVDDEIAWTVDYTRAEVQGMAITIPLSATDGTTGGFDRLLVFGVKSSMEPAETATMMEQLFDAHHYTRGLAIVPQGTPTNNTENVPTVLPRDDPDGALSFAEERLPPPASRTDSLVELLPDIVTDTTTAVPADAAILGRVLGLHNGVFAKLPGALGTEQYRARQMAKLLWPATLGYFVEQIMTPVFNLSHHDQVRAYFYDNVHARGPAPAFRIGQVPYGVLPALSVISWQKRGTSTGESFEGFARDTILRLRESWKSAALTGVPIVSATSADPLADLFRVLALHPSSREARIRTGNGQVAAYHLGSILGIEFQNVVNTAKSLFTSAVNAIGQGTWAGALLGGVVFTPQSNPAPAPLVRPPDALSEDVGLPAAFFTNIGKASVTLLLTDTTLDLGDPALKSTVLYNLVRHAILWALVRACKVQAAAHPEAGVVKELERQLQQIPSVPPALTYFQLLTNTTFTSVPLGDFGLVRQEKEVSDTFFALDALKSASSAELDRLLSETLDLSSHRLDAWLTGFATRRLLEIRAAQQTAAGAPVGNYLGGYAFVENVRPTTHDTKSLPGFGTVESQRGNGGFIQAPSLTHAATAAILRNGYLSYKDEDPTRYAFDLTSARVRAAREILDEVRAGQPLGAVLGYRLERAIQDKHPELNQFRYPLRKHYPLVANKSGTPNPPPADVVAARNVVDGLAVWKAYNPAGNPKFPTASDLPPLNSANYNTLVSEIAALGDILDGVSDLSVGESILQLLRGSVSGASGSLDSLSRGARPPDPDMATSQRGGVPTTHRVALVFSPPALPVATGWTAPMSPRAGAEPLLDAWAGAVLGTPSSVVAHVTLKTSAGATSNFDVSLANLNIRPIDFVALARSGAVANAGSILDRRIATFALGANPNRTVDKIDYTVATGAPSFPQAIEVARSLGALFGGGRFLWGDDLVTPTDAPARRINQATDDGNADSEIASRIGAVSSGYGTRLAALKVLNPTDAQLRTALQSAADYVPDAYPAPDATSEQLKAAAAAIAAELDHRGVVASAVPSGSGNLGNINRNTAIIRAFLGNDVLLLPKIAPPNVPELDQSFAARATLLAPPQGDDGGNLLQQFVQQAGQAFEGLGRWRLVSLYLNALGRDAARIDLAQLPHRPGTKWVGAPFSPGSPPLPGAVSLLLHSFAAAAPSRAQLWQGIMLDEWVEVIPNATEQTGLAFHYDNPGAEAGQAVLVVPPSQTGGTYKPADIWATLNETLDLAKIRAVDLEMVPHGQMLPAIYLSQNVAGATVSTSWLLEALQ